MIDNQISILKEEKIAAAKQKLKEFKKRNIHDENHSLNSLSDTNHLIPSLNKADSLKKLNFLSLPEPKIECDQIKDQLKLHVQTIGILVAEKTELQSRLNQQIKKSEKKQDECDELTGRLKASRQKISELEKLVHQLESEKLIENTQEKDQFDSGEFIINEQIKEINNLKLKLDEKKTEILELIQVVSKLKRQIEIFQIYKKPNDEDLQFENSKLKSELNELKNNIDENNQTIKNQYQSYVDRLQKQVENLVDQINKLTDEREESFSKIDFLKAQLKHNEEKITENFPTTNKENFPKIELLENEIKYFKQQIDILLMEKNNLEQIIESKNKDILNLNENIKEFETERENFNGLLEDLHNNRQTLSRTLKQNNELKSNLEILRQENLHLKDKISEFIFTSEQLVQSDINVQSRQNLTQNIYESNNKIVNENFEKPANKQCKKNESEDNMNNNLRNQISISKENLMPEFYLQLESLEDKEFKEKIIEYLKNMKLIEKKFTLVMEENMMIKEKNNDLEHMIQQLEFETETIVDYITMYQIERKKLNEKFRIKEDTIQNLSSFLNIYKLAFIEIKNLITILLGFEDERKLKNENTDDIDQRIHYIIIKIEKIIFDLYQNFSENSLYHQDYSDISYKNSNEKILKFDIVNEILKFKSETVICSSCYGDLFIV